jgi:ubiquinone biosynthesis accessory factor UbiJ
MQAIAVLPGNFAEFLKVNRQTITLMLLTPLESVLNRNIAASSAARAACNRLAGKTLAMHVTGAPQNTLLSFYFSCDGERMSIASNSDAPPAATLSGTPFAYIGMIGTQPESAMRSGSVRIEGDAEVAQAFRELLKAAQPDFEEELSRVVGDVAAHQVGKLARGALQFGKRVADTFAQNVSEYLQEESRDVVTRVEADEFVESVDQIRDAVDRAEARLTLLERAAGKK